VSSKGHYYLNYYVMPNMFAISVLCKIYILPTSFLFQFQCCHRWAQLDKELEEGAGKKHQIKFQVKLWLLKDVQHQFSSDPPETQNL